MKLSVEAARALHLAAQGLLTPPAGLAQKEELLASIRKMGLLQIDTISVVARSPYLVLWSRLGTYEPRWLEALLAEGALFEYWSHAACFLPIEDYGLYRCRMLDYVQERIARNGGPSEPDETAQRVLDLFGFDYRIEVYTPLEQRRYGYFTLPILHHGALVGRLDPKAHRKEGLFEIKALHLEPGVEVTDSLVHGLVTTLRSCADWHGTPDIIVRESTSPALASSLNEALLQ